MSKIDELRNVLIQEAHRKGICKDGYARLEQMMDDSEFVDYYTEVPEWSMERDFPDLNTLKDLAPEIEDKGVYVCKTFHGEMLNDLQTYIFHNCKGTIKVGLNIEKAIIPMLYLANGCRLRIVGVGDIVPQKPSQVPVHVFGKNDYTARDNKYVKFTIYKHKLI